MVVRPLIHSEFEMPGGSPRRDPGREQGASGAVHSLSIHQRSKTGCMARTHAAHRGHHGNETHMDRKAKTTSHKSMLSNGVNGGEGWGSVSKNVREGWWVQTVSWKKRPFD